LLPTSNCLCFLMSYLIITRTAIRLRVVYMVVTICISERTTWIQVTVFYCGVQPRYQNKSFHTSAASCDNRIFTASTGIVWKCCLLTKCWGKYFGSTQRKYEYEGQYYTTRAFKFCSFHSSHPCNYIKIDIWSEYVTDNGESKVTVRNLSRIKVCEKRIWICNSLITNDEQWYRSGRSSATAEPEEMYGKWRCVVPIP